MTTTPRADEPATPDVPGADGAASFPVAASVDTAPDGDATAVLPQAPASGPDAPTASVPASAAPPGGPYQAAHGSPSQTPQTAPHPAQPSPAPTRPLPRTGPIVWGALILVFCGYVAQRSFGSGPLDGDAWVIATMLGLGAILLAVGTAVIVRNRRR